MRTSNGSWTTSIGAPPKANVWHPVCVGGRPEHEGSELALLGRRFASFVGPGLAGAVVESGIARLGFCLDRLDESALDSVNAAMFRHAEERRGRLVNTRTPEGERLLLQTVARCLADHCRDRPETTSRWV